MGTGRSSMGAGVTMVGTGGTRQVIARPEQKTIVVPPKKIGQLDFVPGQSAAEILGDNTREKVIEPLKGKLAEWEEWLKHLPDFLRNIVIGGAVVAGIVVVGTVKNAIR